MDNKKINKLKGFIGVGELDFTKEELDYLELEMRSFRLPLVTRLWKRYGIPFIKYSFLPMLIIIIILGVLYMSSSNLGHWDWMWTLDKAIAFTYIFGFGIWTLVSHVFELYSTNKLRKRLKLTQREFQILVVIFHITGL